jgi:bifunctional non-homologous end joining protein LigD
LEAALKKKAGEQLYFEPEAALKRLGDTGDLFAPVLELRQALPESVTAAVPAKRQAKPASTLREYAKKRDFSKTAEPSPQTPRASAQGSKRRFVVQKHAASRLHFDFRLEMHKVLKSWAIPKGVPYEKGERRLAMATEDHPIEYLDFEGIIPEGQYGGGTVMVWDIGTYELVEGSYYKGDLQLHLQGKKLKGDWHLTKDQSGRKWFLIKTGTSLKPPGAKRENASALTGRTMEQIAQDRDAQWQSNRAAAPDVG